MFDSDRIYNSPALRGHYGSESDAAIAHGDNTKDFRLSDKDIKPWECKIALPTNFAGLSTIEGLKDAKEGEPEVSLVYVTLSMIVLIFNAFFVPLNANSCYCIKVT